MPRVLAVAVLVGTVAAHAAQAAPPAPTLAAPEEALDRAVHLTWRDDDGEPAREYELQRRRRDASGWSAWVGLPKIPAGAGATAVHFDDRGGAGSGLSPGEYEYRVRGSHLAAEAPGSSAWSEWSAPRRVSLQASSCEPPPAAPALPTVAAGDRNADGRLTGGDLVLALEDCAARGGCILELAPARYDDVAILIYDGNPRACTPGRTACLRLAFPKGLVLQGHGSATLLRSPLWSSPYKPVPVFEIVNRPEIRFVMRNLVLDGRKAEQSDPRPGENDSVTWWHHGFRIWQIGGDVSRASRDGCLHNIAARNFMSTGVRLGNTRGWVIEASTIEDIGCRQGLTECPKLRIPAILGPGYMAAGHGILIDRYVRGLSIRNNRIRRVAKYSIGLKHGPDAMETSIVDPRVAGNEITEAGSVGIFLGGLRGGLISGNLIDHTQLPNEPEERAEYFDTFGISCRGRLDGTEVSDNRILHSAGIGVNWQCSGTGNTLSRNRIEGSCREKNPQTCAPGHGKRQCYDYADITIHTAASAGPLRLVDNEVVDTGCSSPLEIWGKPSETEVVIDGGRYGGGPNLRNGARVHGVPFVVMGGAVFEGVDLEFDRGARGVVTRSVSVPAVRSDGAGEVQVCSRDAGACDAACRAPEPPEWCSEREEAR